MEKKILNIEEPQIYQIGKDGALEYKLAEGIYFTDYRQNKQNQSPKLAKSAKDYLPSNDLNLLFEDFKEFDNRCKQLIYSNDEIQKIKEWQYDKIYFDAIKENLVVLQYTYTDILKILEKIQEIDPQNQIFKSKIIEQYQAEIIKIQIQQKDFTQKFEEGLYL